MKKKNLKNFVAKKKKKIKIKIISIINFALFLPKDALKDTSCCTVFPISTDDDILFIKSFKKLNSAKKPITIVFISVKFCIRCCWSTWLKNVANEIMQYKIGKKNSAVIARVKIVVETALFFNWLFILKNIEFVAIVSKAATAIDFKNGSKSSIRK